MKACLRLCYALVGGVFCTALFAQGVYVLPGQADNSREPLPASPQSPGLPIKSSPAQPAQQPGSGVTNAYPPEMVASLAQLQTQLRSALGMLSSYNTSAAVTPASGSVGGIGTNNISAVSVSGANLAGQAATNVSNRAAGNISVNLSTPAGLPVGGAMTPGQPAVSTPTLPNSSSASGAPEVSPANLAAIHQQISQLMAQLDNFNASVQGGPSTSAGSSATNSDAVERGQQLTPTGRTPGANGRPQPPRNLRLVR